MYSIAKLTPYFETLDQIKQNGDIKIAGHLLNTTINIPDVSYLENRASTSKDIDISVDFEKSQLKLIKTLLNGQSVVVTHTAKKSLLLNNILDDLEIGRHISVSDHKYYPKFLNNYVSRNHTYFNRIYLM